MSKIGIILIFYNHEKYAQDCLKSIQNQTFEKFECICIDDNSKDDTFLILEDFAKKDNRFKALKHNNTVLSDSRNVGLSNLKNCEYFVFMKGCDILHPRALEILHEAISNTGVDFVSFETKQLEANLEINIEEFVFERIDDSTLEFEVCENPLHYFLTVSKNFSMVNIYNKIYRFSTYKEFSFYEDIYYGSDYIYIFHVLSKTATYINIAKPPLYLSRKIININEENPINQDDYLNDTIVMFMYLYENFANGENIYSELKEQFLRYITNSAFKAVFLNTIEDKKSKELILIAQKGINQLIKLGAIDFKYLDSSETTALKQFIKGNFFRAKLLSKFF